MAGTNRVRGIVKVVAKQSNHGLIVARDERGTEFFMHKDEFRFPVAFREHVAGLPLVRIGMEVEFSSAPPPEPGKRPEATDIVLVSRANAQAGVA